MKRALLVIGFLLMIPAVQAGQSWFHVPETLGTVVIAQGATHTLGPVNVTSTDDEAFGVFVSVVGDAAPWTTVPGDTFSLLPGETRAVHAVVEVPGDAEPGLYPGEIVMSSKWASPPDLTTSFTIEVVPACPFDLNGDGIVNKPDLKILLAFWGALTPGPYPSPDVNGDGTVDVLDLIQIQSSWGPCVDCAEDLNNDDEVNHRDTTIVQGFWGQDNPSITNSPDFNTDLAVNVPDLLQMIAHWEDC